MDVTSVGNVPVHTAIATAIGKGNHIMLTQEKKMSHIHIQQVAAIVASIGSI